MKRSTIWCGAVAVTTLLVAGAAGARPNYLQAFKANYKTANGKPTLNAANCALCHRGMPAQKMWNPYGEALRKALGATAVTDNAKIVAALTAIEKEKANPRAQMTFGQLIAQDRMPAAAGMPMTTTTPPATGAVRGEWQSLFDGTTLNGWHKMNAGDWSVKDGAITYAGGGNGWLRSDKEYNNFSLVIVWRYTAPGDNDAGIFLKAGMAGNPWPTTGNQLNMGPGQNFGSIGGTQGSRARGDLIKPNDWNTYQVTVTNGTATLAINGTVAWEKATGLSKSPGYLGVQCENKAFQIAQVWIMPL